MKRYRLNLFSLLLSSSFLYGAQPIGPDSYYPDENLTTGFEFSIEDPGESNSSFVIAHPSNEDSGVDFYSLPTENNLERNDTEAGKIGFNRDYNMSNVSDLDKWLTERSGSFHKTATEITAKVNKKTGFAENADSEKGVAALASDYIYENSDQNSTKRRVLDKMDDIYDSMMAKISNRKQIKCYISRKLKPGYMCPLPSMENSFILGYAQKDSKETSIEECNKRCKIEKSCTSKEMGFDESTVSQANQNLYANNTYTLNTNSRQTIKSISFTAELSDLNETKLEEEKYFVRYGIEYYFLEEWHTLFEGYRASIYDGTISVKVYLNRSADQVRIKVYTPYEKIDNSVTKEILLDKNEHPFVLTSASATYTGTKHWYCPNTQYVFPSEDPTVACKDGTLKDAPTGSAINQVCVPDNMGTYRDSEYGGYKSQSMCEAECFIAEECIPTYRQPSQVGYDGYIPDNKYDIEIGCVDDSDNEACTQELCQTYFMEDSRPILEKIWTNNDEIVTTIKDGSNVEGTQRPKIDVAAELSSNSGSKDKVFKDEMKDAAYVSMIRRGTYNVSTLNVEGEYDTQMAYEYKTDKDTGVSSLVWLLKASSKDYDDDDTYYFNPILGIDIVYHPIKAISVGQNVIYASEDPNIRAIDRVYVIGTSTGWKVFRREEYVKLYTKGDDGKYGWSDTSASAVKSNVTFSQNEFMAYDTAIKVEPWESKKLNSDAPYERFTLSLDMQYTISQIQGVLFSSQSNTVGGVTTKLYSADTSLVDNATKAYIYGYTAYGLYYPYKPRYNQFLNSFYDKQFFDSLVLKSFPSEIKSETIYTDNKVKMFMHGSQDAISVNADFDPDSEEEGKKSFFFIFLYDE